MGYSRPLILQVGPGFSTGGRWVGAVEGWERYPSGTAGASGERVTRWGVEMVEMRIVIPPGQGLPSFSAHVSIGRAEAIELRNALDLVQATGSSGWSVNVEYAELEAHVTLMLDLDIPRSNLKPV